MTGSYSLRRGTERDGYWQLRVALGRGPDGKYHQATRGFRGSKGQAKKALAAFAAELMDDKPVPAGRMTFGDLLERFIADREARGRADETLLHYRSQAKRLKEALGHLSLRKVGPDELESFYAHLTAEGRSPTTVQRYHALVRAAFNFAMQRRWTTYNPAPATARPTPPKTTMRSPTVDEVQRLLEAAEGEGPEIAMFLRLAVDTSARRGEIAALRRTHVDLRAGQVLIESATTRTGETKDTKTHSRRMISLSPNVCARLANYYRHREDVARRLGTTWLPDAFLFSDDPAGSTAWRPNIVSEAFDDIKKRAGVTGIRLHDLRHFGATQMLAGGASIVAVSHRLGHRRVSVTLDVYSHAIPASDQRLADFMGAILTGGTPVGGTRMVLDVPSHDESGGDGDDI